MDKLEIEGGTGLRGEVTISGAKNAALPVMAASILTPGEHYIYNIPILRDITTMGKLLAHMGMGYHLENEEVILQSNKITSTEAPYDFVKTMRASVLVLGPMLARMGEAKVSLPGGCAIGARPINLHIMGLQKMGAQINLTEGYIHARARKLKGASICFDIPTVTGTENLMMAATLAEGDTFLENAACEPEVVDLANALISMGAKIEGAGTNTIKITGVTSLNPLNYTIVADRIETGTFMIAAAITGGDVVIKSCRPEQSDALINKMREAGVTIRVDNDSLRVRGPERIQSIDIKTAPYPGFPTDMQAQFMALMSIADGSSLITESIFENGFMHVAEIRSMGATIRVEGSTATVRGVRNLVGAPVMATDLRASASLVLAGLASKGKTTIDRVYHIDRGYEKIEEKLQGLGSRIRRIQ